MVLREDDGDTLEQKALIRAMKPKIESVLCEIHARFADGDGVGTMACPG
jgi:hypothetical protein